MRQDLAIEVRQLERREDLETVVDLQREIWGFEDVDLLPLRLFVVATKIGGQVLGAYSATRMVGFCVCIPGLKAGAKAYLHSHMMGVLPTFRNEGVGRALKLKQREYAVSKEIDLIEWTFDPLELKNAFFNIERLGAIVRRYVHNQYGMSSSHLHAGLPTDRLVAEWWVHSERADALASGRAVNTRDVVAQVCVPVEIDQLKRRDERRASDIQAKVGQEFERHFREGLAVVGFEKSRETGIYLLGRWESN
jgi:predicted GNAT superfamily acetyltransferase